MSIPSSRTPGTSGAEHERLPAAPATAVQARDAASPPVRVILVGRTGLELALRLDSTATVSRVSTPLQAIGELSSSQEPPELGATVIVGDDADPGTGAEEFVRGLRLVNPAIRVLRAAKSMTSPPPSDASPASPWYDAIVFPQMQSSELRAMVRAQKASAGAQARPTQTTPPPVAPAENTTAAGTAPAAAPADAVLDISLINSFLAGRDVVLPAMQMIRARLGVSQVYFASSAPSAHAPDGRAPIPDSDPPALDAPLLPGQSPASLLRHQAPVEHDAHQFGILHSSLVTPDRLRPWAAWLAASLALRDQTHQLRRDALVDELTGAWNRRYFNGFLAAAIKQAGSQQPQPNITVLVFDIDDFKRYNDKFGHEAGDEILSETVRLLTSVIRPSDRVCRIGGDEFVVVFHEPDGPREPGSKPPSSIWSIAQRFQRQICEHRFPKLAEEAPGTLTVSGGLATYPWDGLTPQELLKKADDLAMQSKHQGKNAITLGPGAERVCRLPAGE